MKSRPDRRVRKRVFAPALISVLRHYHRSWLAGDVVAGLSACVVMIPSVIAYAELVHLPPITGLYAALAAALGYALFGSSRHVIAGPDAAICLLVGAAILPLGADQTERLAMLAAELGLITGAVLVLAAWLKLSALHRELEVLGVQLKIADAPRPFREQLEAEGVSEELGNAQFFISVKKAVEAFEARVL